jgi:hypothetical protein
MNWDAIGRNTIPIASVGQVALAETIIAPGIQALNQTRFTAVATGIPARLVLAIVRQKRRHDFVEVKAKQSVTGGSRFAHTLRTRNVVRQ